MNTKILGKVDEFALRIVVHIMFTGATLKLTEACRRFLLNPSKDVIIQRWAIEGLSYLTLDAEVKEKLLEVIAICGSRR